jgi:hypothetical protein
MNKYFILLLFIVLTAPAVASAQQPETSTDTFFLAKKTGLLGKLGRSISRNTPISAPPVKAADPFKKYNGKIIRFIEVVPVGFNQNLNDTAEIRRDLAVRIADEFHRNSRSNTIRKNLFFKEGDVFLPLLVADNERFLRNQPFLRDAVIVVYKSIMSDSVDIIVLTRDVFSIGGSFTASGLKKMKSEIREENLGGTGARLAINGLYDIDRSPTLGFGAEYLERNIKGSFLTGSLGFKTFKNAIANNRFEESTYYLKIDKPLINRYTEWTGAFSISHHETSNAYLDTSTYLKNARYKYHNVDLWGGYNIGWGRKRQTDSEKRLRHFVAARAFYNFFDKKPQIFKDSFNYNYVNQNGLLFSYTLYKQNFYLTNFIYGFGRNEDVPIGINATLTAGWTNTQGRMRGYYGAEFDGSVFSPKGFFSAYTLRAGGYRGAASFEDINLLLNIDHFTRLRQLSRQWLNRNFISVSYARLFNQHLGEPLKLQSDFGLPYFKSDSLNILEANSRATIKLESVFFNLHKFLGFRFAPFIFAQFSFLRPLYNNPSNNTDGYTSVGGGVRTRNENLVLGTVELRGFYFPRVSTNQMSRWKIQFNANLRFKYNSTLVSPPNFVGVN